MVAYAYQCARIITWDRAAGFNNHATFQVLAFLMGTQGDKRGIAAVDLNLQHPAKPSCRLGKGSPSKVARSCGSLPSMRNKRGACAHRPPFFAATPERGHCRRDLATGLGVRSTLRVLEHRRSILLRAPETSATRNAPDHIRCRFASCAVLFSSIGPRGCIFRHSEL
jgi:hypothetical protein